MISLDWKKRLLIDTNDFLERKLPKNEYDIDFIYNAYPARVDNKIPKEVIAFVAKKIVSSISKKAEDYMNFYEFLWNKKGENGKYAFTVIMSALIKKKPDLFLPYIKEKIIASSDLHEISLLLNKSVYVILRKNPKKYLDELIGLIEKTNEKTSNVIVKLLIKFCKNNPEYVDYIFKKFECKWLSLNLDIVKHNSVFLKAVYSINQSLYFKIYENYKNTRNPIAVEILCKAIDVYSKDIENNVENWSKSGNNKIKKAALAALKVLKKKKVKNNV